MRRKNCGGITAESFSEPLAQGIENVVGCHSACNFGRRLTLRGPFDGFVEKAVKRDRLSIPPASNL
jgi:hypothetical protein